MNRKLKFRVYIPDHEKLCYFDLGKFDYSDRYLYQHSYPVQQYTGLKDKNDKEIYEGDIVRRENPYYTYEVEYNAEEAAYILRDTDEDYLYLSDFEVIVIGNAYEPPELIVEKND